MVKFKVASVFSSNCVLQRNKKVAIFGEAEDGSEIKIEFRIPAVITQNAAGKDEAASPADLVVNVSCRAQGGKWLAFLPAMEAAKNCSMTISCGDEKKEMTNIAIGEVWLLGGQSNMEFELQNCTTGKEHLENDHPDVRFYYTQKKGYIDEDFLNTEAMMAWSEFNPESAKCWSAAGYIFGKKLSEEIGVTVGLIGCNWGGTSASVWMSKEALSEDEGTNVYLQEYLNNIAGKSDEEQAKEYADYLKEVDVWNEGYGKLWAEKPGIDWNAAEKILGKNPWPGPINSYNPFRPGGLHECMILRVCPYTLRGFTFYQGESDDHRPQTYYRLFTRMIKQWRDDWGDESLPFIFVQLPGHRYENDPDYKHWCIIREAQQKVSETVPETGMAVIIDAGEFNDIHPKDKEPVGDRMCRIALEKVYGLMSADEAEAPEPERVNVNDSLVDVKFKYAGEGLMIKAHGTDKSIAGFELAGEDKVFKPAKAVLSLSGTEIMLSCHDIEKPVYVRYLWTNYPERISLYSRYGVPVRPFRTDSDESEKIETTGGIKQIMEL